jgi:hypothetical protein
LGARIVTVEDEPRIPARDLFLAYLPTYIARWPCPS